MHFTGEDGGAKKQQRLDGISDYHRGSGGVMVVSSGNASGGGGGGGVGGGVIVELPGEQSAWAQSHRTRGVKFYVRTLCRGCAEQKLRRISGYGS